METQIYQKERERRDREKRKEQNKIEERGRAAPELRGQKRTEKKSDR